MNMLRVGWGAAQFPSRLPVNGLGFATPVSVFSLISSVLLDPSDRLVSVDRTFQGIFVCTPCGSVDSRNITPSFCITPIVLRNVGEVPGAQVMIWAVWPPSICE